jgi:hypothetical protein
MKITLTTWLLSPRPNPQSFAMSSIATSARTLSTFLMLSVGGVTVAQIIRTCQEWQWTILSSLVSVPSLIFISYISFNGLLATSVGVERTFSKGRLLLSHIRNRLSVQSTRALMCLGVWSVLGYVRDRDINGITALEEVVGEERIEELSADWDAIDA